MRCVRERSEIMGMCSTYMRPKLARWGFPLGALQLGRNWPHGCVLWFNQNAMSAVDMSPFCAASRSEPKSRVRVSVTPSACQLRCGGVIVMCCFWPKASTLGIHVNLWELHLRCGCVILQPGQSWTHGLECHSRYGNVDVMCCVRDRADSQNG